VTQIENLNPIALNAVTGAELGTEAPRKAKLTMRIRLIGLVALVACAVGYAGFLGVIIALKLEKISTAMAITFGGIFAVVGEAGLWVGAACLGLGLYTRRKEKIARFIGSVRQAFQR